MSKVGIMSMQRIKNYGSFLQAFALKNIIEELGHEVEFVDYHVDAPLVTETEKKSNKFSKGMNVIKGNEPLMQKIKYIFHKNNFEKKYFKLLNLSNEKKYNTKVDTLVIGSDEVFNCIQSNVNVGYSLELFGKNNNAKKVITYAASFGNTTLEKVRKFKKEKELAELLKKINKISVRDENSGHLVKEISKREAVYHLDPVLVFDYMSKDIIPQKNIKEKYILVYAYSGRIEEEESKYIKKLAKKNRLKVYSIGGAQKCADKFIDCTPFEVFNYFANAEFVITDTFHGSIFSIVTHQKFVTIVRKSVGEKYGNEEKLTDLLNRLNLKDRIVFDYKNIEEIINKKINYEKVEKILECERKKTLNYLKEEI